MKPSHPDSLIMEKWRQASLATQFVGTGAVILLAGMLVIGIWVTREIEKTVTRNTASSTALYLDSFVAPLVQGLANRNVLSPETHNELDRIFKETALGKTVVSFKIWKEGGFVAYSSRKEIIGRTFPVTDLQQRSWNGEIAAEFESLGDEEDALERAAGLSLLEIYSPVRENRTGRIIAVAEFYETADVLTKNLFSAKLESWFVVALVTLSMFSILSGIVLRGSRTIGRQRQALEQRVIDLSRLLVQNEELRIRVQGASERTTEINERNLRRISADIHDGPAQLLALASLRLGALIPVLEKAQGPKKDERSDLDIVRQSMTDALSEIRNICAGLVLPELSNLSPARVIESASGSHERRTDTTVDLEIDSAPDDLTMSMKICLYRFVQEALSNSFRHADGKGQRVVCRAGDEILEVEVSDTGPGFDASSTLESQAGLGLLGLRERIESLGGVFKITSTPGDGTRLVMRCTINPEEISHG